MARVHKSFALGVLVGVLSLGAVDQAFAQGATIEAATDKQKSDAQKAFLKAQKAFEKGNKDEALAGFKESYGIVASPNSHLMVARTLEELERPVDAYLEYKQVVAEAEAAAKVDEKYQATADSANKSMGELAAKLGMLTVTGTTAGGTLTVADREVPESEWSSPIPVQPGTVKLVFKPADGAEIEREATVDAGATASADFAPAESVGTPPPAAPPPEDNSVKFDSSNASQRTWAYVAAGVGAAGFVTFGVFGILHNSKLGKLEDECPDKRCPADLESDADAGRTYGTVANIGLVVGVVGLGAGAVLFLTAPKQEKVARPHTSVGVGPGSLLVRGTF